MTAQGLLPPGVRARRGSHGRPVGSDGHAGRGTDAAAAGPECTPSSLGFDPLDDSLRPHADYAAACHSDGHDPAGAPAGGLPFFAPGPGHTDRAVEPDVDGAGLDDDLVSDDPGTH